VCTDPASRKSLTKTLEDIKDLADDDIAQLVLQTKMKDHELEKKLDPFRAVDVRRIAIGQRLSSLGLDKSLESLPSSPSL
jgi:hypothetical protein